LDSSPDRGKGSRRKQPNRAHDLPPQTHIDISHFDTKHIGNIAEMEFMLQAQLRGFAVGRPFGDSEHYDVMLDSRTRLWRIQVKLATHYRNQTYSLRSHWSGYGHLIPYTPKEIDFLAGFVRPHALWYLIPAAEIRGRFTLNLYPQGARRAAGEFEPFKEAWDLLTANRFLHR
jgi:hypothetical protein